MLLGVIICYYVLLCVTRIIIYYCVLLDVIMCYYVLLCLITQYYVALGVIMCYINLYMSVGALGCY